MKSSTVNKAVLELEDFEVQWLRNIMQNPIGCSYEEEFGGDREMRKKFWEALGSDGVSLTYPQGVRKLNEIPNKSFEFYKTDPDNCSILNKPRVI